MWIIVVVAMFGSLIGFTQLPSQTELARVADASRVVMLAENMASYRTGVIDFANANPGQVCDAAITIFPTGYLPLDPPLWANCILADGTIVVYARYLPDVDITDAISALAQRSVLAGRTNTAAAAPASAWIDLSFHGADLRASAPALPAAAVPLKNGVPVWLAHRD